MAAALPARRVELGPARPGEFEWVYEATDAGEGIAGMAFRCPCGCGREGLIEFSPARIPSLRWDGSESRPTLDGAVTLAVCPSKSRWRLVAGFWRAWEHL